MSTLFSQKQRRNRASKRGSHPRSLANLKPFAPGKSGNPGGLPKGSARLSTAYQKLLGAESLKKAKAMVATLADEIALGVIEKALAGEVQAAREVADRTEGKVPNKIEDTEGGPMKIEVVWVKKGLAGEGEDENQT